PGPPPPLWSVRPISLQPFLPLPGLTACASPLTSERLVPAVPRESQHPVHAPYAPIAVCPVFRRPTDLSQWRFRPLVLTMLKFFTTLHRRVCLRSSPGRTPARGHALSFFAPTLTTTAFGRSRLEWFGTCS